MIYNVDVIPGLSDHDIITANLLHRAFVKKSKRRKVFTFRRGNSARSFFYLFLPICHQWSQCGPHLKIC